ncbi:MAG: hypothetical protein ACXV8O_05850 [Methylobacter sp.]
MALVCGLLKVAEQSDLSGPTVLGPPKDGKSMPECKMASKYLPLSASDFQSSQTLSILKAVT